MKKLSIIMCLIFVLTAMAACGGSGSGDSEEAVDSATYIYEDDGYKSTITIEYNGDTITKITDLLKENFIDFDDKVFNERKAYYKDWEKTSVDGYVATAEIGDTEIESKLIVEPEVAGMDLLKKDYIWWNTDKDYVSLEEFTKQLTKDGYKQK